MPGTCIYKPAFELSWLYGNIKNLDGNLPTWTSTVSLSGSWWGVPWLEKVNNCSPPVLSWHQEWEYCAGSVVVIHGALVSWHTGGGLLISWLLHGLVSCIPFPVFLLHLLLVVLLSPVCLQYPTTRVQPMLNLLALRRFTKSWIQSSSVQLSLSLSSSRSLLPPEFDFQSGEFLSKSTV